MISQTWLFQEMLQVASIKASFGTCMLRYRDCSLKWMCTGTDSLVTMAKSYCLLNIGNGQGNEQQYSSNSEYCLFSLVLPTCTHVSLPSECE